MRVSSYTLYFQKLESLAYIFVAVSEVSEEVANQIAKIAVVNNHTLIWRPRQQERLWVSTYTLYFQKLRESLAYIFVAACMGLSSFKFVLWAP